MVSEVFSHSQQCSAESSLIVPPGQSDLTLKLCPSFVLHLLLKYWQEKVMQKIFMFFFFKQSKGLRLKKNEAIKVLNGSKAFKRN